MNADGIGVDHEVVATAHADQAILLLEQAQEQSDANADERANDRYHSALEEEDPGNLLVGGAEVAQGSHIVLLVDDEHGQ